MECRAARRFAGLRSHTRPRCPVPADVAPLIGPHWCSSHRQHLMESLRLLQVQFQVFVGGWGPPYRRAAPPVEHRKGTGGYSLSVRSKVDGWSMMREAQCPTPACFIGHGAHAAAAPMHGTSRCLAAWGACWFWLTGLGMAACCPLLMPSPACSCKAVPGRVARLALAQPATASRQRMHCPQWQNGGV